MTATIVVALALSVASAIYGERCRRGRASAMAAGAECAHKLAAAEHGWASTKSTLSSMAALCRELETRVNDIEDPPVSREELKALARALALKRSECESLRARCDKFEEAEKSRASA